MAVAAWVAAGLLGLIAFSIVREGDQQISDLTGLEGLTVTLPVTLGFAVAAIFLAAPGGDPLRALRMRFTRGSDLIIGAALGVATQFLLVPIYVPILLIFDGDVDEVARDFSDSFADNEMWILVLFVVLIAPICEEMFYRGLIQGSLERSVRPWIAISISSVIFGVIHFQLLQLPGLIIVGAVAGVALWKTNRLSMAIAVHMGFNAVTAVQLVFDRFG